MARYVFVFLAAIASLTAGAQTGFESDAPIAENAIDQWTSNEGLVSNNLTHVLQARSGFIWISCYSGMSRFDGQRFELFNRNAMPFLTSEAFYRIYESKTGDLWLTSQGSGVVRYSEGQFRPFVDRQQVLPRSIRCLAFRSDGAIYAGSNNQGLYLIKDSTATRIDHPALNDVSINCLEYDNQGRLWIGTNGKGLSCLSEKGVVPFTIANGLFSNVINTLTIGTSGEVIVGTSVGLNVVTHETVTPIEFLKGQQINDLRIDDNGALWAATAVGLARLQPEKKVYEFISRKNGLPSLEITGLNFDREGSLWLTTSKGGLVRLKASTIRTYTTLHGLSTDEVNVITEDRDGRLFVGSDGGDVDILNGSTATSMKIHTDLANVGIRDILIDADGVLWISSYSGVLRKKGDSEKLFTVHDGLPAEDIRRIFQDKHGNLWFGSRSGGLIKFRDNKVIAHYDRTSGMLSNYVLAIEEDKLGNIYAGTNGGGLVRISPDGTLTTLHLSNDDGGLLIFNIQIDAARSMWLITNQGIYHYNGDRFRKVDLISRSTLGTFFDWQEDKDGGVWVSTNKGILYFRKENAAKFVGGALEYIPVDHFDDQDGMRNRECTSATRIVMSANGDIWIPTIAGVSRINPKKILRNNLVPPVYVTHIVMDRKDTVLTPTSVPIIKPGNLRYTFQFTGLSLLAPKKVNFRYQLVGVDKSWVNAGPLREAQYTNLAPGRYEFKVVACNNDGVWNEAGTKATIVVLPFFYQTVSFYVLIALLLGFVLFLIYKWRMRILENRNQELKKLNSELDKFVYSASHDLRAPLSSILGLVNVARQEPPPNKDFYLNLIEKSVHKLDQFVRDIIDFSRNARVEVVKEEIHFEELIQGVMDEMRYMDENNRILRTIKVMGRGPFYSDSKRLTIILNNLVANAIKYHNPSVENPFIEVRVEQNEQSVVILVSDNGNGIAAEHIDKIFQMFYRATEASKGSGLGLYIVRETVEKLSGTISVKSTLGEGSTFKVTLPSLR